MLGRSLLVSLLSVCAAACGGGALAQSQTLEGRGRAADPLTAPIAVGAVLTPEIVIETQGSAPPALDLLSVRPEVVASRGRSLLAKAPGVSAVLIREPNGTVIDLLHVWVAAPTHLEVHRLGAGGEDLGVIEDALDLVVGDAIMISPRAYAGAQRLAGAAESSWSVDPPQTAVVLRDGAPERRRLLARVPGKATLTIRTLGRAATVRFDVVTGGAS